MKIGISLPAAHLTWILIFLHLILNQLKYHNGLPRTDVASSISDILSILIACDSFLKLIHGVERSGLFSNEKIKVNIVKYREML